MDGPVEASADLRMAAKNLRQLYLALIYEGFTEQQALAIVGNVVAAGIIGGGGQP